MTTHDIDAAAERLIDSYEDGCLFAFGVSGGEWSAWVRPDRAKQMVEIMKVYLAQRARERAEAEERAKPVTVEWVDENTQMVNYSYNPYQRRYEIVPGIRLIAEGCPGGFRECVLWTGSGDGFRETKINRGQVLDLLRALGVETKKREGE